MRLGIRYTLMLAVLSLHLHVSAQDTVTVVLSESGGVYSEFASQLGTALGLGNGSKAAMRVVNLNALKDEPAGRGGQGQVWVAVGTPAMTALARKPPNAPVMNVLVPRASFRSLARSGGRTLDSKNFSAVYFDQPWSRQLALIQNAVPGRRVGILLGKDSADLLGSLQAAAREANMVVNIETVAEEADLLPSLKRLLPNCDALLAVPDAAIYNRSNIATILLTSYRAKVPLFGFSSSYVKAGALAAVFSQPEQIAQQVAEIIQKLPASGSLPAPQSPKYFSIAVNDQVRLSLELTLADEAQLLQKLKQVPEGGP